MSVNNVNNNEGEVLDIPSAARIALKLALKHRAYLPLDRNVEDDKNPLWYIAAALMNAFQSGIHGDDYDFLPRAFGNLGDAVRVAYDTDSLHTIEALVEFLVVHDRRNTTAHATRDSTAFQQCNALCSIEVVTWLALCFIAHVGIEAAQTQLHWPARWLKLVPRIDLVQIVDCATDDADLVATLALFRDLCNTNGVCFAMRHTQSRRIQSERDSGYNRSVCHVCEGYTSQYPADRIQPWYTADWTQLPLNVRRNIHAAHARWGDGPRSDDPRDDKREGVYDDACTVAVALYEKKKYVPPNVEAAFSLLVTDPTHCDAAKSNCRALLLECLRLVDWTAPSEPLYCSALLSALVEASRRGDDENTDDAQGIGVVSVSNRMAAVNDPVAQEFLSLLAPHCCFGDVEVVATRESPVTDYWDHRLGNHCGYGRAH
jgi:hypothetical protein